MKKSAELREDIESGRNRIEGIIATCERENRELSDAESAEVDSWIGTDDQPGRQSEMIEALGRQERIETEKAAKVRETLGPKLRGFMQENGAASSSAPTAMRDSKGNRIYALNRDQRVQDVYPSACPNALGEVIRAMVVGTSRHAPEPIQNFMSTINNPAGGYAVPEELSSEIIDLARAKSVIMSLGARTTPMSTGEMTFAKVATGATIEAKTENSAFTERELALSQVVLSAFTIGTLVTVSRELAEDAPNFPEMIAEQIAKDLATKLDYYTIQGTGSAEPEGIINNADIDSTGTTGIGALEYSDLGAAAEQIRVRNHEPTGTVLHPSSHSDMLLSTAGNGTDSERIWLTIAPTIEGQNLAPTTNCPLANGIMADWSKLMWGIRTSAMVEADTSGTRFDRHQIGLKIVFRGDFAMLDVDAFHLLSGITS